MFFLKKIVLVLININLTPELPQVSGLGMNEAELKRNPVLSDFVVHDLNVDPKLPYDDNSFDFITNAVSVDYMNRPRELFGEILRVLKPGGCAAMSFSNRCFPTKAVDIWGRVGDKEHIVVSIIAIVCLFGDTIAHREFAFRVCVCVCM